MGFLKKRGIVFGVCLLAILLVSGYAVYAIEKISKAKLAGQKQIEMINNPSGDVIVSMADFNITQDLIDQNKAGYDAFSGAIMSDTEIINRLLKDHILYNDAVKAGVTASDDEIDSIIKLQQNSLQMARDAIAQGSLDEQSISAYTNFMGYLSGLGMTEDEFFNFARPIYENMIYCGKFKSQLKDEFSKNNAFADQAALNDAFNAYLDKYLTDQMKDTNITIYDPQLESSVDEILGFPADEAKLTFDFDNAASK